MPRPVCITYDSTCDLTPQLLERFHIRTIPLTIQSGGRVFPDDGNYTSAELYTDYRRNGTLPKTTAISPEAFKAFFSPLLAEGYDIVHIDISSELSCTCQNAVLAAQELTKLVRELAPFQEVFVTQAGCTVSSHCGPGTLGVLFLRQPEQ